MPFHIGTYTLPSPQSVLLLPLLHSPHNTNVSLLHNLNLYYKIIRTISRINGFPFHGIGNNNRTGVWCFLSTPGERGRVTLRYVFLSLFLSLRVYYIYQGVGDEESKCKAVGLFYVYYFHANERPNERTNKVDKTESFPKRVCEDAYEAIRIFLTRNLLTYLLGWRRAWKEGYVGIGLALLCCGCWSLVSSVFRDIILIC